MAPKYSTKFLCGNCNKKGTIVIAQGLLLKHQRCPKCNTKSLLTR